MLLDGQIAIVTGSDSGIGRAIAIEFAHEGADVVVTYHSDRAGGEETCRGVEDAGRRGLLVQLDSAEEASVEAMFDEAIRAFGHVDVLVNNAGVNGSEKPFLELDTETWDRAMRTNLYGYFFGARRFARERQAAGGGGCIVNITSVHDEIPMVGATEYDATKGGQQNLMKTIALELAPLGIRVNSIGPGMILTPMNQDAVDDPSVRAEDVRHIPLGRAGEPRDIARVAAFLASDGAAYVTGATWYVDGGLMLAVGQGA
jgi:glucose 1-dehydrogenase